MAEILSLQRAVSFSGRTALGIARWVGQRKASGFRRAARSVMTPSLDGPLVRSMTSAVLTRGGGILLSAVTVVVLARLLGAEDYGIYAFAISCAGLAGVAAQAGLPPLLMRELSTARLQENWPLARGVVTWVGAFLIVLSVAVATATWLLSAAVPADRLPVAAFALALVPPLVLANGLFRMGGAAVRALGASDLGLMIENLLMPSLFLILLLFVWPLLLSPWSGEQALVLRVCALTLVVALTAIVIFRRVPGAMLRVKSQRTTRRWLGMALNFAISGGALAAIQQIDILMIGVLRPIEDVGIYRVAGQGALVVGCAAAALMPVAAMRFIEAIARNADQRILDDIRLFRLAGLGLVLPPLVMLLAFGNTIIPWVFGAVFAASVSPMIILSLQLVPGVLTNPIAGYQSHSGAHGAIARFLLTGAAANLVLNALLIPMFGINGAALATAASLLFVQFLVWRRWRGLEIRKMVG